MNYKGHATGGAVVAIVATIVSYIYGGYDYITSAMCGVTAFVFALYPDLDIASKPSRYAYLLGIPAILYLIYETYYLVALLIFLFITVPKMFPHRGLVHTIKFGVVAVACWMYCIALFLDVNMYYILGAGMIGYLTHLISDKHVRL